MNTGVSFKNVNGFHGALRARYFSSGPLIEDDSIRSRPALMLNARLGYQFNKTWDLTVSFFNLLNRKDHDISYFYESRLSGEPAAGISDTHFHPVEPFGVRAALTARF